MLSTSVRSLRSTPSPAAFHSSLAPRKQPPPLPVDIPSLQSASQSLNDLFLKDAQAVPDVGDLFTTPASATYSVFADDYRVPFQKRRLIGLPGALFNHATQSDVSFQLGVFPEIDRVWMIVDNKLFLWEYMEGEDLDSYVDQPDNITHVALVPAKPSVFVDEITHVLVICTHFHIRLLGVSFSTQPGNFNRTRKPINLYATDMTIALDTGVTSVVGTPEGRIFMCGTDDGNLYELHYQQSESWFGKRIQLINHSVGGVQSLIPMFASINEDRIVSIYSDRHRRLIYTVTSKQNIHIYQTNGEKAVRLVQTLSNLFKSSQDKAPSSNALSPTTFIIVSLSILDPSETRAGVQFIAVLKNGTRLYFSPSLGFGYSYASNGYKPLGLSHVRLPPQTLPDIEQVGQPPRLTTPQYAITPSQVQAPSQPFTLTDADCVSYVNGLMLISQPGGGPSHQDDDYLVCIAPDLARIGNLGQLPAQGTVQSAYPRSYPSYDGVPSSRPALTEYAHVTTIPGHLGAIAPVPRPTSKTPVGQQAPNVLNDLALQFSEMPREFMVVTNSGIIFLVRRRVVDYLKAVLEEVNLRGNIQPIIEFRDSFGRDETCSMLLALASGNTFMGSPDNPTMNVVHLSSDIKEMASQAFWDFGERPTWTERTAYGSSEPQGTATFSGRRQGFALYFARLVRPIWKAKLSQPSIHGSHELGISDEVLIPIQKNLDALKKFLDQNPNFFFATPADTDKTLRPGDQEAWKIEHNSVTELKNLLIRVIEAISFVLLLSDYRLGELIARCDPDMQKLVTGLTFEELITTQNGMTASRALVNVIIDQQIGMQISVDTISEILQSRCGTFCSTDDVMLYKAKENVRKAVETKNLNDRLNWLNESLRLFSKGARIIQLDKLREIVGDYQQLSYAKGAVELPLLCAQLFDPDEAGLACWYAGSPQGDSRAEFCERRLQCYDLVLDSLSMFEEQSLKEDSSISNEYQSTRAHAYELAFASDDEMFHSTMYDWLIERGHADELLQLRPAFLEAHLRREPISVQKYQLLWQFYVKDGQPLRAAEILGKLAESTQFDLSLEARLEYLTLAVGNAKSHPVSGGSKQETAIAFLTDLEEKLEVAQVQLEILSVLQPFINENEDARERAKVLSSQLLDITMLYQEFAEHFELNGMKLLCLHVSEHRDENLVRSIWNTLFNEWIEDAEGDVNSAADRIVSKVMELGQRFYPSEYAFPLRHVAMLLVRFSLSHKGELPLGWAPRALVQCGVPYGEVWDVLHEMYESQVPPFNDQLNVQHTSSDIAVLLNDWLEDVKRPRAFRPEFPVGRIDEAVDQYLSELEPSRVETKGLYEGIKRQLRMYW